MEKQPFLLVILENDEEAIINEGQVVSIKKHEKGARLRMSNGDEFIIKSPPYDEWENDFLARKD